MAATLFPMAACLLLSIMPTLAQNQCTPNPCQLNGFCVAYQDDFICVCPMGAIGKTCIETTDPPSTIAATTSYQPTMVSGHSRTTVDRLNIFSTVMSTFPEETTKSTDGGSTVPLNVVVTDGNIDTRTEAASQQTSTQKIDQTRVSPFTSEGYETVSSDLTSTNIISDHVGSTDIVSNLSDSKTNQDFVTSLDQSVSSSTMITTTAESSESSYSNKISRGTEDMPDVVTTVTVSADTSSQESVTSTAGQSKSDRTLVVTDINSTANEPSSPTRSSTLATVTSILARLTSERSGEPTNEMSTRNPSTQRFEPMSESTEGLIISKCVPGLCGIGGVCLTIPIGFFCICPEGLSGDRCQLGP
ncbi:uncharacterized protein [Apostichopus japonicus]|uniref:uncharacterized protein isoform X2 n=1 Tax=Stichopus japonicus TaxID=307972 RepID=UPI003AB1D1F3